jgi:hypothetical protein
MINLSTPAGYYYDGLFVTPFEQSIQYQYENSGGMLVIPSSFYKDQLKLAETLPLKGEELIPRNERQNKN